MTPETNIDVESDPLLQRLSMLRANIESVFMGKPLAVEQVLIGLIGRGHVLIEDVPGVGKTVLARALARSVHLSMSRIQMTPDLLPSDIIGVSVYDTKAGVFEFKRGPIFANVVFADEINRTTPRTQSALLEAMSEAQVSVDGHTTRLEQPFFVIATQNPFEFEGTYYLPENQLDRFALRIRIGYPSREVEARVVREQPAEVALDSLEPVMSKADVTAIQKRAAQVRVDDAILDYALDLVEVTRHHEYLEVGVSPRGTLTLVRAAQASAVLAARDYVVPDDVKSMFVPVCAHRLMTKSYLHEGHAVSPDQVLGELLRSVTVPE